MKRSGRKFGTSRAFRWIQWARDQRLPGARQAVLIVVATHCDRDGSCFLTYETIASEAGCVRSTAIRSVRSLKDDGYITAVGATGRSAKTYRITGAIQPSMFDTPTPKPGEPWQAKATRSDEKVTEAQRAAREPRKQKTVDDELRAFLKHDANMGQQIAALVRAGKLIGLTIEGDTLSGVLKRQTKTAVAHAMLWLADDRHTRPAGNAAAYIERMIEDAKAGSANGQRPNQAQGRARKREGNQPISIEEAKDAKF